MPDLEPTLQDIDDVTVTGSTPAKLPDLEAGPNGVLVVAHPNNGTVIIRVGDASVKTNRGKPLAAKASFVFPVTNASKLYAIVESGSGVLCVGQA